MSINRRGPLLFQINGGSYMIDVPVGQKNSFNDQILWVKNFIYFLNITTRINNKSLIRLVIVYNSTVLLKGCHFDSLDRNTHPILRTAGFLSWWMLSFKPSKLKKYMGIISLIAEIVGEFQNGLGSGLSQTVEG